MQKFKKKTPKAPGAGAGGARGWARSAAELDICAPRFRIADAGQLQFNVVKLFFYKTRKEQPKRPQNW